MELTIWLKGNDTTLYIGGDPEKNQPPVVTAKLKEPQLIIEPDKCKITVKETR